MVEDYSYQPLLGRRDIRLVKLNACPRTQADSSKQEIECDLFHVSLDESPQFEALSYTWGCDTNTAAQEASPAINCSGKRLRVTHNLLAALRCLQPPTDHRIFWIDAICINQHNLKEKGIQVSLMSKIYASAEQVIVWLGEEEEFDALAFETAKRLEYYFRHKNADADTLEDLWRSKDENHELPIFGSTGWAALGSLLSKKWFQRVWVVQEVVMAKQALVLCGVLSLHWQNLTKLVMDLASTNFKQLLAVTATCEGIATITLIKMLQDAIKESEDLDLFDVLTITLRLKATDPRDKIYSMMGIVHALEQRHSDEIGSFDYETPSDIVFKQVAIESLTVERNVRILSIVDHGLCLDQLDSPSWVPTWVITSSCRNPFVIYNRHFNCSRTWKAKCRYANDGNQLIITGFCFDSVRNKGNALDFANMMITSREHDKYLDKFWQMSHERYLWLRQCQSMRDGAVNTQDTEQGSPEAFWRTLICNTTPQCHIPGPEYQESFEAFNIALEAAYADLGRRKDPDWLGHDKTLMEDLSRKGSIFETALSIWNGGRVFCTTSEGRMGMLPQATNEGDVVCVFAGGKTPFVIRPDGHGAYRLVGECYLHGLMNGEYMDKQDWGKDIKDIVLI